MESGAAASCAGSGASATLPVASDTSADGGASASAKKPSLVISDAEWDKHRKRDLFPGKLQALVHTYQSRIANATIVHSQY